MDDPNRSHEVDAQRAAPAPSEPSTADSPASDRAPFGWAESGAAGFNNGSFFKGFA